VPASVCRPNVSSLAVTVMETKFSAACLAAPAGTPFTIRFDNEDTNTHNLDIRDGTIALFTGQIVVGPKIVTYQVGALPAGTYQFRCDVHPTQMHGTFVVGE
jgi:plastocyanin